MQFFFLLLFCDLKKYLEVFSLLFFLFKIKLEIEFTLYTNDFKIKKKNKLAKIGVNDIFTA